LYVEILSTVLAHATGYGDWGSLSNDAPRLYRDLYPGVEEPSERYARSLHAYFEAPYIRAARQRLFEPRAAVADQVTVGTCGPPSQPADSPQFSCSKGRRRALSCVMSHVVIDIVRVTANLQHFVRSTSTWATLLAACIRRIVLSCVCGTANADGYCRDISGHPFSFQFLCRYYAAQLICLDMLELGTSYKIYYKCKPPPCNR
jgi:hypothetical protein